MDQLSTEAGASLPVEESREEAVVVVQGLV